MLASRRSQLSALLHVPTLALFLLGSCVLVRSERIESGAESGQVPDPGAGVTEAAHAPGPKESALELAKLSLASAHMAAELSGLEVHSDIEVSGRELEQARKDIKSFAESAALRLRESTANMRRAEVRLEEQAQEMQELEAMYAEEEFAEMTKELVLARGRHQIEAATEVLEISRARHALLEESELVAERSKHEVGLHKAELALRKAELAGKMHELKSRRSILEAEESLRKAERALNGEDE